MSIHQRYKMERSRSVLGRLRIDYWIIALGFLILVNLAPILFDNVASRAGWFLTIQRAQLAVIDGDTLRVGDDRIRLKGIDACELGQPHALRGTVLDCGRIASAKLSDLIGKHDLLCIGRTRDRYGRRLARCLASNRDLGEAMIDAGVAWSADYGIHIRSVRYWFAELFAALNSRGIHQGEVERPAQWRNSR